MGKKILLGFGRRGSVAIKHSESEDQSESNQRSSKAKAISDQQSESNHSSNHDSKMSTTKSDVHRYDVAPIVAKLKGLHNEDSIIPANSKSGNYILRNREGAPLDTGAMTCVRRGMRVRPSAVLFPRRWSRV